MPGHEQPPIDPADYQDALDFFGSLDSDGPLSPDEAGERARGLVTDQRDLDRMSGDLTGDRGVLPENISSLAPGIAEVGKEEAKEVVHGDDLPAFVEAAAQDNPEGTGDINIAHSPDGIPLHAINVRPIDPPRHPQ